MARDAGAVESQEYHLAGLLLVASAAALGLVLALAILLLEIERRADHQAALSAAAQPAPATAASSTEGSESNKPAAAPVASGQTAAVDGSALFASTCGGCHPNGGAGLGPTLKGLSAEAITRATRDGKGAMPAFKADRLSDQQLQAMVAFLGTAAPPAAAALPAAPNPPTSAPTSAPTMVAAAPVAVPTAAGAFTASPAVAAPPTAAVTAAPTAAPTIAPTLAPTAAPTAAPAPDKPASAPAEGSGGSAAAGGAAFASSCGACHPKGGAGIGPDLRGLAEETVVHGTREGKGMMPAFKPDRLSDEQLRDIVAFLRAAS